jgi:hypothetical protein
MPANERRLAALALVAAIAIAVAVVVMWPGGQRTTELARPPALRTTTISIPATTGAPQPAPAPDLAALVANLAVLRRPQTAADRGLPAADAEPVGPGQYDPSYTRLVARPPGATIYLAVDRAPGSAGGDAVFPVIVMPTGAETQPGQPAARLYSPSNVLFGIYVVEIVPDGVVEVRWRFKNARPITAAAHDNAAIAPSGGRLNWQPVSVTYYLTGDRAFTARATAQPSLISRRPCWIRPGGCGSHRRRPADHRAARRSTAGRRHLGRRRHRHR